MSENPDDILLNIPGNPAKLSRKSVYNIITSVLPGFIAKETSIRSAFNTIHNLGYKIGRTKFTELYYAVKLEETGAKKIQFYDRTTLIPSTVLQPTTRPLNARYRFVAQIQLATEDVNTLTQSFFSLDTNSLSTLADVEQTILDSFTNRYLGTSNDVVSIQIIKGYRRA